VEGGQRPFVKIFSPPALLLIRLCKTLSLRLALAMAIYNAPFFLEQHAYRNRSRLAN
jgi:hypothetical protein